MYESRLMGPDTTVPDYDRHITAWLAAHPGTEFGGTAAWIALLNDDNEIYRLISAEGIIDLIGLASMLMKLGMSSAGPVDDYDDTFRMPSSPFTRKITPSRRRRLPAAPRPRPVHRRG